MFFLISGAAASGKSTLARLLPQQFGEIECHDADELVATTMGERWLQLEHWVQLGLAAQARGQDFLLASNSPMGELLTCPSAIELNGIAACLADCADPQRIERIRARGIDPRWPPTQDTINWAAWHRMHAYNPQWEARVIGDNSPYPQFLPRWTAWTRGDPRWQVTTVDTTPMSIAETVAHVAGWIAAARARPAVLTPTARWWE